MYIFGQSLQLNRYLLVLPPSTPCNTDETLKVLASVSWSVLESTCMWVKVHIIPPMCKLKCQSKLMTCKVDHKHFVAGNKAIWSPVCACVECCLLHSLSNRQAVYFPVTCRRLHAFFKHRRSCCLVTSDKVALCIGCLRMSWEKTYGIRYWLTKFTYKEWKYYWLTKCINKNCNVNGYTFHTTIST